MYVCDSKARAQGWSPSAPHIKTKVQNFHAPEAWCEFQTAPGILPWSSWAPVIKGLPRVSNHHTKCHFSVSQLIVFCLFLLPTHLACFPNEQSQDLFLQEGKSGCAYRKKAIWFPVWDLSDFKCSCDHRSLLPLH